MSMLGFDPTFLRPCEGDFGTWQPPEGVVRTHEELK